MSEGTAAAPRELRAVPLLLGLLLLLVHARLGAEVGFRIGFGGGPRHVLGWIGSGELRFWLSHVLLALPGVVLVAWGVAGVGIRRVAALREALARLTRSQWRLLGVNYGVLLFALATVGRQVVLLGLPITDDENAVRFGARMIAAGHLRVPVLQPADTFTNLFTYVRDGYVSSLDFPGTLFFAAFGEWSGLHALLYAAVAALTGVALAAAAGRLLGRPGAVWAALLWLASPMALTLSFTTHAHLVSRACVAGALWLYARLLTRAEGEDLRATAFGLGLLAGLGFLTRPAEVGALLLAPGLHLVWRAARGSEGGWRTVGLALAGLVGPLALFAWYNAQITGLPWLQARRGPGVTAVTAQAHLSAWTRLGNHLGFNALMLAVWVLGPLGLALVAGGVRRERPETGVLLAGVGTALGVALLHDNTGIHMVGPIHYSEAAVPLILLAACGAVRAVETARRLAGRMRAPAAADATRWMLAATAGLGSLAFLAIYVPALRRQAELNDLPFAYLRQAGVHHAFVLAFPPSFLHALHSPDHAGSWVLQFPHPDPFFRDDWIFARYDADVDALKQRFPDRDVFRLHYPAEGPFFALQYLGGPSELALKQRGSALLKPPPASVQTPAPESRIPRIRPEDVP